MIKDYDGVTICASKYYSIKEMKALYNKGVFNFGENRVQDFLQKKKELIADNIIWHFIGHVQTNKVKMMINEIDYLHTLDRMSLVEKIQKYVKKPLKCLIQVNLTKEEQKSGVLLDKLDQFILEIKKYDKIDLIGLMTIGKDNDMTETDKVFNQLHKLTQKYQLAYRSMGMTHDYEIAIKNNATHLRIGRKFKELLK